MTEVDQALEDDQDESTGVYRFDELSDKAKEAARTAYRDRPYYPDDDWYEYIFETAVRMGAILGIDIDMTMRGRSVADTSPKIYFTMHVQGSGACYEGRYTYKADAVEKIKDEAPEDSELHGFAERLTVAQTTARMLWGSTFTVGVQSPGRNTSMRMTWSLGDESADISIDGSEVYAEEIEKVLSEFADWIFSQLEGEYDYQVSDDCIDQYLSEMSFTGDGEEIA